MNLFRLFQSPSLSPHQKCPKSNLPITSFQIYVVSLTLLLKSPDSSEGQPILLSVFFVFTVLLSRLTYALLSVTLQQVQKVSARSVSDCEEKASGPPRVLPQ